MTEAESAAHYADQSVIRVHRYLVVRIGLVLSWFLLGTFGVLAWRQEKLDLNEVRFPLIAMAVLLALLTLLPWRRFLRTWVGDALIVIWATGILAGLVAANEVRATPPLLAAYVGVIVLAAATLVGPGFLSLVAAAAVAAYLAAVSDADLDLSAAEMTARLTTLVSVAALGFLLSFSLRRHLGATGRQLDLLTAREAALRERETDLTRLYAVSRTIGTSTSEVLPELVSRVAHAVGAKVGLVLLYNPEAQGLEVVSPIWVSGHALRAEGYLLPLTEASLAQKVFISSDSIDCSDPDVIQADYLLGDLDAEIVAAVPLRLEMNTIGVMMVTDPDSGQFTDEDVAVLQSLAGPASLVLNHLSRYQEAQETTRKMSELARLKTDFVSVVSHELRTPLTSIIGSLATLSRPQLAPTDTNAQQLLVTARGQAERLKALIEDLLVVSRLDNRALPQRPVPVALAKFLPDTIAQIPGAEDVVSVDCAPGMEPLQADPEHLHRIVVNLTENALKYAPDSRVEITARPSGPEVWVAITDHGPGIPYELHDHIFERFTQLDDAETRMTGGTGLGLSIVRGLTEAMGGGCGSSQPSAADRRSRWPSRRSCRCTACRPPRPPARSLWSSLGLSGDGVESTVDVDDFTTGLRRPI